jgi:hypothetical protein
MQYGKPQLPAIPNTRTRREADHLVGVDAVVLGLGAVNEQLIGPAK